MMLSRTTSSTPSSLLILLLSSLLLLLPLQQVSGTAANSDEGIVEEFVHVSLKPDGKHVHFLEVKHLELPGYIDLTGIEFATIDDGHDPYDDDDDPDGYGADTIVIDDWVDQVEDEKEEEAEEAEADDLVLLDGDDDDEEEDDDVIGWLDEDDDWMHPPKISTKLDIAIVHIPADCTTVGGGDDSAAHCDFTEVGVGRKYSELYGYDLEEPYWCCTDEEVALGLCNDDFVGASSSTTYGRMMMNLTIFDGSHRSVDIPPYGEVIQNIMEPYGRIEADSKPGKYAIIIANCNEVSGREVVMRGNLKVKSSGSGSSSSSSSLLSPSSSEAAPPATPPSGTGGGSSENTTQFNTAMKSFAKKSIEKTRGEKRSKSNNNNDDDDNDASSSFLGSYGITLAILVFGLAGAAYIARDNIGKIPLAFVRGGYNSLELSEMMMDGQINNHNDDTANNYVPIDSTW